MNEAQKGDINSTTTSLLLIPLYSSYPTIMLCVGGCMDVWMDGCMDGWMDGWMDGSMDGCPTI